MCCAVREAAEAWRQHHGWRARQAGRAAHQGVPVGVQLHQVHHLPRQSAAQHALPGRVPQLSALKYAAREALQSPGALSVGSSQRPAVTAVPASAGGRASSTKACEASFVIASLKRIWQEKMSASTTVVRGLRRSSRSFSAASMGLYAGVLPVGRRQGRHATKSRTRWQVPESACCAWACPLAGHQQRRAPVDVKLLAVAGHARKGRLLLGVPVQPDVPLDDAPCTGRCSVLQARPRQRRGPGPAPWVCTRMLPSGRAPGCQVGALLRGHGSRH